MLESSDLQIYNVLQKYNLNDIRKITSKTLKRINVHIHNDDKMIDSIKKLIQNKLENNDPYYYCDKMLVKKVEELIKSYNKIKMMSEDECCICLDKCEFEQRSYFMCNHFTCKICFNISNLEAENARCPICRTIIKKFVFSDKYAIICTGIPTKLYTFENGGYKSMCIVYFPEYNGEKHTIFNDITYHDENKNRSEFTQRVYKLMDSNYIIILQNHKEIIKWMNEMMLKDLASDKRLIHE